MKNAITSKVSVSQSQVSFFLRLFAIVDTDQIAVEFETQNPDIGQCELINEK